MRNTNPASDLRVEEILCAMYHRLKPQKEMTPLWRHHLLLKHGTDQSTCCDAAALSAQINQWKVPQSLSSGWNITWIPTCSHQGQNLQAFFSPATLLLNVKGLVQQTFVKDPLDNQNDKCAHLKNLFIAVCSSVTARGASVYVLFRTLYEANTATQKINTQKRGGAWLLKL